MRKHSGIIIGIIIAVSMALTAHAVPIVSIPLGGTGTSTVPGDGYILIGSGGRYKLTNSIAVSGTTPVSSFPNDVGYSTSTGGGVSTSTANTWSALQTFSSLGVTTLNLGNSNNILTSDGAGGLTFNNTFTVHFSENPVFSGLAGNGVGCVGVSNTGATSFNSNCNLSFLIANNLSDSGNTSTLRNNIGFRFLVNSPLTLTTTSLGIVTYGCATCLTTSTGLTVNNFATTSINQWVNNGLYATSTGLGTAAWRPLTDFLSSSTVYLSTSTGLTTSNFTSANLSLWTNNLFWVQSSSLSAYLTTSTGLTKSNFVTSSISQWVNDIGFITTSSVVSVNGNTGIVTITSSSLGAATNTLSLFNGSSYLTAATAASYATSTVAATWTAIQTFSTTSTFNATVKFASSTATKCARFDANQNLVSATGDCPAGAGGAGAAGTVTTSTVVTANYIPFWNATDGTGLNGTSTLFVSALNLYTGGSFNASGTITKNGVAVLTTSTGLTTQNFSSNVVSQWAGVILAGSSTTWTAPNLFSSQVTITGGTTTSLMMLINPFESTTSSVISMGTSTIQGGSVSGTFIGINTTSSFNGDFLNFQVNSSTKFKVSSSGVTLAGSVSSTIASALWSSGSNGVLTAYTNQACTVGSLVTSVSAAGALSCNTTSSILTGYTPTASLSGYATSSVAAFWTATLSASIASSTQLQVASATLTTSFHVGTSTFKGWINVTGTVDTVTSCGTAPVITGTAGRGQIKTGSNATSTCTITFGIVPDTKPYCNVTRNFITVEGSTSTYNASTTATTLRITGNGTSTAFASTQYNYWCWTNN